MQIQKILIRMMKAKRLILAVTALAMSFSVSAQDIQISLPTRELSWNEVVNSIESQTSYVVAADKNRNNNNLTVKISKSPVTIASVLDQLLSGTGLTHTARGNYILIHKRIGTEEESNVVVVVLRNVAGTVIDEDGKFIENATVEILDVKGAIATTHFNGRFHIKDVPAGVQVARLTSADGQTVRYREIVVPTGGDADVSLTLGGDVVEIAENKNNIAENIPVSAKSTTYYVINQPADFTIKAFSDEPKSELFYAPTSTLQKNYLPKAAVKTNLLYLGVATPNVAVELGLARKWTLDLSVLYNPFTLQKGGVNRFWAAQPELRYWFCNRFERHFVGLHGIYGQFNIGDVDFLTTTFEQNRYKGWGAGAGISYGYHLPIASRWALEFTVGAGYVYLEYDKFRCYECDEFVAKKNRHYFGPTKAGISLIFMIR